MSNDYRKLQRDIFNGLKTGTFSLVSQRIGHGIKLDVSPSARKSSNRSILLYIL